jgi:hypothetical protein
LSSETDAPTLHEAEVVPIETLRPHPRNYREHGVYRNVIVAEDGTILAGHGVVAAAVEEGAVSLPVVRLAIAADDPRALKLLTADNELARLALVDDATLAALLSEVAELDVSGLLGTGYDDDALADLVRVVGSRGPQLPPEGEWVGMPPFTQDDRQSVFHTTVHFATEEDAGRFFDLVGVERRTSIWWPEPDGLVGSDARSAWVSEAEATG